MKRKMVFIGMGYACGLFFASFFKLYISLMLAAGIVAACVYAVRRGCVKQLLLFFCAFAFGVGAYEYYTRSIYEPILSYAGSDITLSGRISAAESYSNDTARYIVSGKTDDGTKLKAVFFADDLDAKWGDRVTVCGSAELPENTYTFPANDFYRSDGIFLELRNVNITSLKPESTLAGYVFRVREKAMTRFDSALMGDEGDALCAMLFGAKTGLDTNAKTLMYRCGIGHVMSASGLHLVVVTWAAISFIGIFTKNKRLQAILAIAAAFLFTVCAGFAISVIRAFLMLTLMYSARFFIREADSLNSLSVAVLLILLVEPYAVTDSSLLLSAAGTYGISTASRYFSKGLFVTAENTPLPKKAIMGFIRKLAPLICVSACVFPVSLLFFDEISLISPLTNLLLVPICTLALILGFIAAFLPFAAPTLIAFAGGLCRFVLFICEKAGSLRMAYIPAGKEWLAVAGFAMVFVIFLIWLFTVRRSYVLRTALLSFCFIAMISSAQSYASRDEVHLAWFGTKRNGGAMVLSCGESAVIIDTGGSVSADESVRKFLSREGVRSVALLYSSDRAASRIPAYLDELELFDIGSVYYKGDFAMPNAERLDNATISFCGYEIMLSDYPCIDGVFRPLNGGIIEANGDTLYLNEDSFVLQPNIKAEDTK